MRRVVIGAIAGAVMLIAAAVALAVPASQTLTYNETFSAKKPNTSAATSFSTSSSDPNNTANNNQPVANAEVDIKFPSGMSIDYTTLPLCTATNNQITQSGGTACSNKTKVGTGTATASLPFPGTGPITVQLTAWNGKKELIIYVKPSVGQPFVLRSQLKGNVKNGPTLVTPTPPNCLPPAVNQGGHCINPNNGQPGQEAVLTSFSLSTLKKSAKVKKKVKNYLTTPKTCPAAKKWTFTATFKYEDGTSRTATSTSPCTKK